MLSKEDACDSERLEMFLEHQLDKNQTLDLEAHLGICRQCRQHLEDLAASPDFWSGVEKRLREPADSNNDMDENAGVDDGSPFSFHERLTSTRITKTRSPGDDRLQTPGAIISFLKQWLLPTDDPDSLGRISGYEVTGIIGVGGMSVVLKGFDRSLNRFVAIKVLATHLAACGAARKRFAREARAAAAVVHDNVLAIHAIDELMDLPYLVMPYVRGESLETRLTRQGPLGTVEVLRIAHQIAAGLAAAHAQGLVHRDIKPANILLDEGSERLKIADFGLARAADDASLTHSGSITGTPLYMSPEQARGDNVDQRSDIFSFGSLLYTLCAGHPPFRAETPYGIIRRICDDQPRPIQQSSSKIPLWLSAIIESMMEKDIHLRCDSALKLSNLFMKGLTYVQNPGGDPLPDELHRLVPSPLHKRRLTGSIGNVAILALLVAGALATWLVVENLKDHRERENEVVSGKPLREKAPEPSMTPLNIDPDTGERQGDAITLPDELPIRSGLFYRFSPDETHSCSVLLEIDRPAYRLVIGGLIAMTPDEVTSEFAEYVYQLQLSQDIQWKRSVAYPHTLSDHETHQLRYCEPRGRFKVDHLGRIIGRSHASRVPGELGPILDWVFPVLDETPASDWSVNRNLELFLTDHDVSSQLDVMGFDAFDFLQSRDSIFVDRELNYRRIANQETGEPFQLVHFEGSDIPEQEFQVDGQQPREMKGWFRFDTVSGMMKELAVQRSGPKYNADRETESFDVKLQLKWLEPDEAESIRSRVSSNKK